MNNWIPVTEKLPAGNGEIYEGYLEESTLVLVYGQDAQTGRSRKDMGRR